MKKATIKLYKFGFDQVDEVNKVLASERLSSNGLKYIPDGIVIETINGTFEETLRSGEQADLRESLHNFSKEFLQAKVDEKYFTELAKTADASQEQFIMGQLEEAQKKQKNVQIQIDTVKAILKEYE